MSKGEWHGTEISFPAADLPSCEGACVHGEDARIDLEKVRLFLMCADCGKVSLELESCPEHLIEALQSMMAEDESPACTCQTADTSGAVPDCLVHQDRIEAARGS